MVGPARQHPRGGHSRRPGMSVVMNKENRFSVPPDPSWGAGSHRLLLLLAAACLFVACGTTDAAREGPVATPPVEAVAEYPEPLHGHWMPVSMACPSPVNYDSDSLIVIDKNRLAQYEDGNKVVRVRQISTQPRAWAIDSLLNIAGDGYDTPVTEVFVLGGSDLAIVGRDGVDTYRKCN